MSFVHPSANYVHFLLSKYTSTQLPTANVLKLLGELGLPVPQDLEHLHVTLDRLEKLRKELQRPSFFTPRGAKRPASKLAYLKKWGIEEAWVQDSAFINAQAILQGAHADVRRALCVALLGPIKRSAIAERIREHFGLTHVQMNPRVVLLFEHYFWNAGRIDIAKWREFFSASWYPPFSYLDDFLTVLELPRSTVGGYTALDYALRSGETPETTKVYGLMKHRVFSMFLEAARPAVKASVYSRAASVATLFSTYRDIEEEQERLQGGNSTLIEELRLLTVAYDETAPKTFHALPRMLTATTSADTNNIEEEQP